MSIWSKLFSNFQWQNRPSTATPLGKINLQKLNDAIDGIDDRVVSLKDDKAETTDVTTALAEKVDKVAGKGLSTNDYDNTAKGIVDGVTSALAGKVDKVEGKGLSTNDYDNTAKGIVDGVTTALAGKVDKVEGYGLSENDFTTTEKTKLAGISAEANKVEITPVVTEGTTLATISIDGVDTAIKGSDIDVDSAMSPTSTNPVQNKVIYSALNDLLPEETAEGNPISITDASGLSAKSCEVTFSPIQSGSGDPSPENVRPISGRDSLVLRNGGKNLFDISTMNHSPIVVSDGVATATAAQFYSYYENGGHKLWVNTLPPRITMSFYAKRDETSATSGNGLQIKFVYKDGTVDTTNLPNSTTEYTQFTITSRLTKELDYITIGYSSQGSLTWNLKDIQIETGATATDFVPFVSLTPHTATFSDTVYGGSYDFVSGEGLVNYGMFDLGDLTWTKDGDNRYYHRFSADFNMKTWLSNQQPNGYCSCYSMVTQAEYTYRRKGGLTVTISSQVPTIMIYDPNYNESDFQTYINGNKLCYELATPTEITLTAEQIALLKGNNTLWTDGDNIELVYSADIKQWTLNQLQS